ncbi:class I SAM-dependent methyltransferase [Actinosynnema sp. NPDC020468]|uniref:class I SAM-dependent methyltransferase n=1 Tax=Actinosynnema sp. NPDC020468 TaxID=3154488 RepID=UPI0033FB58D5
MDSRLDSGVAREWVRRWDRQQERYIADREERFRIIGDVVERVCEGVDAPVVVDLGCGPGSLTTRLRERLAGRVVGVDADRFLLELAHATDSGADYLHADLTAPGWTDGVGGKWDAAVSTTALHWLRPEDLAALYRELAEVIRPGGVLVDGDHLREPQPTLRDLAAHVRDRRAERAGVTGNEEWRRWWESVRADPHLTGLFTTEELSCRHGGYGNGLGPDEHVAMLRSAGFAEAGVVWQYGDDHVLVAVR